MVSKLTVRLSDTKVKKYIPFLVKRDGKICLYCETEMDPLDPQIVVEHLNNNPHDNRIENLILAHQSCNIKKITNKDYQKKATNKLEENEYANYHIVEPKELSKIFNSEENNEELTEIEISERNRDIVLQHITETIQAHCFIEDKKALDSCTFLCVQKTGHGSQQAVRRYIDLYTSDVGPFMRKRDVNGKKIIVERPSRVFSPSHSSDSEEISV